MQWRNLLPNVDLSVDFRYADKVARDRVFLDEAEFTQRPDQFFDISGATFGLSYRW